MLVTNSHIICLREIPNKKGMATITKRRPLTSLVKITSKKNTPELISFKYGNIVNKEDNASNSADSKTEVQITAIDQFLIPEAGEASKAVKMQVIKILDII